MSLVDAIRFRLRSLLRARTAEQERTEEIEFHHSLSAMASASAGVERQDAQFAARREFGNKTLVKEEMRHLGALRWIDTTAQDLRYGLRTLRRSPVFTCVAVLSLALGIGANTAIFGVLHALMLQPVAVPHPEEMVALQRMSKDDGPTYSFGEGEYRALQSASVLPIAAFTYAAVRQIEIGGAAPDRVGEIHLVDGDFFMLLEIAPAAGRLLTRSDIAAASPVVVISSDFAERNFGGARAALGKSLKMNDIIFGVVGVTPPGFKGLNFPGNFTIAAPLSITGLRREARRAPRGYPVTPVARVKPNEVKGAQEALDAAFSRCCAAGQFVQGDKPSTPERATLIDISHGIPSAKMDLRAQYGRVLAALMGGVAVLLLIACANVGNLLLARASARARELAVRLSLGASRWRVMRQLLIESGLLAGAGAVLGLMLAVWGTRAIAHYVPPSVMGPIGLLIAVRPQVTLLAFSVAVAVVCTGIFGVLPAIRATRFDIVASLRDAAGRAGRSPRAGRLDRAIVAAQVALALLLVSSAALLVETLRNLRDLNGGFDAVHLVVANIETRDSPYTTLRPHYQEMLRRVNALPGVQVAAIGSTAPLIHAGGSMRLISVPGYEPSPGEQTAVHYMGSAPNYFSAAGIALRSGRDFATRDGANTQPVAIISEKVARKYYGGRDPLGTLIRFSEGPPVLVVGVVADVKYFDVRAESEASLYVPMEQWEYWDYLILVAQVSSDPNAMAASVRGALRAALPGVNVRDAQGIAQILDDRLVRERLSATLAVLFGTLALALAAVGLYGVMAYQVTARTAEIGVRMALGARAGLAMWLILRQSLLVVAAGAIIGVPLALGGARFIAAQLYGITPADARTLIVSLLVLFVVGVFASVLPARRAARVDPLVAIRAD
ncbi:MAG TPA: ABC transporter permease [Gemmatimonadaceae bacterium]|jgi:predicted permease|nr:ABC transporter permease [Gemmatimonadaceae bacterium]